MTGYRVDSGPMRPSTLLMIHRCHTPVYTSSGHRSGQISTGCSAVQANAYMLQVEEQDMGVQREAVNTTVTRLGPRGSGILREPAIVPCSWQPSLRLPVSSEMYRYIAAHRATGYVHAPQENTRYQRGISP
jgi:hypothetical protein